jgi:hypothetical protein
MRPTACSMDGIIAASPLSRQRPIPRSVLDPSPIVECRNAGQALRNSLELPRHFEALSEGRAPRSAETTRAVTASRWCMLPRWRRRSVVRLQLVQIVGVEGPFENLMPCRFGVF